MTPELLKAFKDSEKHWKKNAEDYAARQFDRFNRDQIGWFMKNCQGKSCPLCIHFGNEVCGTEKESCPLIGVCYQGGVWWTASRAAMKRELTQKHIDDVRDEIKKRLDTVEQFARIGGSAVEAESLFHTRRTPNAFAGIWRA